MMILDIEEIVQIEAKARFFLVVGVLHCSFLYLFYKGKFDECWLILAFSVRLKAWKLDSH